MIENMTKMMFRYLSANQTTEINTINMYVKYEKNNISALSTDLSIDDGLINLPSYCDLLENMANFNCRTRFMTHRVIFFYD